MTRVCLVLALALSASFAGAAAQTPSLKDVLARLDRYLLQYEQALTAVVAEERYAQVMSDAVQSGSPRVVQRRVLLSDYALARSPGGHTWTGFRDTFEVDGAPVRNREAPRIAFENGRYNIGEDVAVRNINVPTVALDLMHPANRSRFSISRSGGETIDGTVTWHLVFTERERPTIIRDLNGRDRRARGSIWVDPSNGDVLKTTLQWDGQPEGFITVHYERDPNIGALVPVRMTERYRRDNTMVDGEATYRNYRRFQTSARIVP